MARIFTHRLTSRKVWMAAGLVVALGVGVGFGAWKRMVAGRAPTAPADASASASASLAAEAAKSSSSSSSLGPRVVRITAEQQKLIGVEVQSVGLEPETIQVRVPGRVAPDENRFAFITPRAQGIVRSVAVRIGQDVEAGDVLATVESAAVGQARLDLLMNLQALDVAKAQAQWQAMILKNTLELIERLKADATPDQINAEFVDKPVGTNRQLLMTAYTTHRLAKANLARQTDLYEQEIIRGRLMEESKARYDADLAAYQTLMDQMGYDTNLANIRAQQALRQAETGVLVAREKLNVLGVDPDEDDYIPKMLRQQKRVVEEVARKPADAVAAAPAGADAEADAGGPTPLPEEPASLYKLKAPFAGTILDRELIVPGVAVDVSYRLFTLANLDHVWIEANINPSNLPFVQSDEDVSIAFESDAYPGRQFQARLLYTGDMVVEKTQTVTLLARAENLDHSLKPGMYIDVALGVRSEERVPSVPSEALISDDDRWIAFVRVGAEEFEMREVETRGPGETRAAIAAGLEPGEEVVTKGAFKLKAEWLRLASSES